MDYFLKLALNQDCEDSKKIIIIDFSTALTQLAQKYDNFKKYYTTYTMLNELNMSSNSEHLYNLMNIIIGDSIEKLKEDDVYMLQLLQSNEELKLLLDSHDLVELFITHNCIECLKTMDLEPMDNEYIMRHLVESNYEIVAHVLYNISGKNISLATLIDSIFQLKSENLLFNVLTYYKSKITDYVNIASHVSSMKWSRCANFILSQKNNTLMTNELIVCCNNESSMLKFLKYNYSKLSYEDDCVNTIYQLISTYKWKSCATYLIKYLCDNYNANDEKDDKFMDYLIEYDYITLDVCEILYLCEINIIGKNYQTQPGYIHFMKKIMNMYTFWGENNTYNTDVSKFLSKYCVDINADILEILLKYAHGKELVTIFQMYEKGQEHTSDLKHVVFNYAFNCKQSYLVQLLKHYIPQSHLKNMKDIQLSPKLYEHMFNNNWTPTITFLATQACDHNNENLRDQLLGAYVIAMKLDAVPDNLKDMNSLFCHLITSRSSPSVLWKGESHTRVDTKLKNVDRSGYNLFMSRLYNDEQLWENHVRNKQVQVFYREHLT
jgi:L-rhamnose mutarotase